jgi:uncharacterized protein YdhG (YjbR/CyaY superfamily)
MATEPGDRTRYWPAIEKKYGHDMAHWFDAMKAVEGRGYADQMAFLQEEHGFSRAHANALVMYTRGSGSSKRFDGLAAYLDSLADPAVRATVEAVLQSIRASFPDLDVVISWNQPMLKLGDHYVFAVSGQKAHVLLAPWSGGVLTAFRPRLEADGFTVNKKTFRVPADWQVDADLLRDMVGAVIDDLAEG